MDLSLPFLFPCSSLYSIACMLFFFLFQLSIGSFVFFDSVNFHVEIAYNLETFANLMNKMYLI